MFKYFNSFFIILIVQLCIGCSTKGALERESLYNDIGGHPGITNLVNVFVKNIAHDKEILPYFSKSSVKHFKQGFINHLCDAIGGPCQYNGDTMIDIHTGMNINEKDFNRVVELLIKAMEEVGISYQSQNKILLKLAPLRGEIIKL